MAVDLCSILSTALGTPVSPITLFNYPTLTSLAGHLLELATTATTATTHHTEDDGHHHHHKHAHSHTNDDDDNNNYDRNEGVAIIGIGCRFPGGANNSREFWETIAAGVDTSKEINRWNVDEFYNETIQPGKMNTKYGCMLDNDTVSFFDPNFFGISAREAITMDPQHRLLLECSWEAMENAGIVPAKLACDDPQVGVFIGNVIITIVR